MCSYAHRRRLRFAGCDDLLLAGCIARQDLRDEEYLVAPPGDCVGHQLLGSAIAVHFGRVDQRQTQVDAELQCRDFLVAPIR